MTNEIKKKATYFDMYKAIMNFLMIESNKPSEYNILISSKKVNDYASKVNIKIINNYSRNENEIMPVTLTNAGATELIDSIRDDFIANHYITYASVNENEMTQTIQNTRFSLIFKLNTTMDLLEACEYNARVNLEKETINQGKKRELGLK